MKKLLLGAHMPISGGFYKSALLGQEVGCSAIQIFTKSNRQWQAKPILATEANLFSEYLKKCNIAYVAAHASYLINVGSSEKTVQTKSIAALITELERCATLKITDLVLHPGAKKNTSEDLALKQVAQNINSALANSPKNTRILLETMAGHGSSIGSSFEQLATIIGMIKDQSRVGICLDTCHIFAAGYDFATPAKYLLLWHNFANIIGLDKLGLMHLNDSKKELGSHVDRHEDIGKGKIGKTPFELIINDEKLIGIPKILETPKTNLVDDKRNITTLISLLKPENRKYLKNTNLEMYLN